MLKAILFGTLLCLLPTLDEMFFDWATKEEDKSE